MQVQKLLVHLMHMHKNGPVTSTTPVIATTDRLSARRPPRHLRPAGSTVTSSSGWSPRTWLLLVVLCGAVFLDALDVSMVGVALPSIGTDLGLSPSQLQWIV